MNKHFFILNKFNIMMCGFVLYILFKVYSFWIQHRGNPPRDYGFGYGRPPRGGVSDFSVSEK